MLAIALAVAAVVAGAAAGMALGWVPAPKVVQGSGRRAAALAVGLVALAATLTAVGATNWAGRDGESSLPAPPTAAPGAPIEPPPGVIKNPLASEGVAVAVVAGLPGAVDGWADAVRVAPGSTVSVLIFFRNDRDDDVDHVVIRLSPPPGFQVLDGGVVLVNGNYPSGFVYPTGHHAISRSGVDIGSYGPAGTGHVRVRMTVPTGGCGQRRYAVGASVRVGSHTVEDGATVDSVAAC